MVVVSWEAEEDQLWADVVLGGFLKPLGRGKKNPKQLPSIEETARDLFVKEEQAGNEAKRNAVKSTGEGLWLEDPRKEEILRTVIDCSRNPAGL